MFKFFSKLLDTNEKEIRRLRTLVERTNALEGDVKKYKDADFGKKTATNSETGI